MALFLGLLGFLILIVDVLGVTGLLHRFLFIDVGVLKTSAPAVGILAIIGAACWLAGAILNRKGNNS